MKQIIAIMALATGAGCASTSVHYTPPTTPTNAISSKTLQKPLSDVWKKSIPELGKKFFVINNIDKDSGLINISYSGDPAKYIDCGQIVASFPTLRGDRVDRFNGADAQANFMILNPGEAYQVQRHVTLEGRVNLIFEQIDEASTKVSANTKYVTTISTNAQLMGSPQTFTESKAINFNTGGAASLPPNKYGFSTECRPTGALEQEILDVFD